MTRERCAGVGRIVLSSQNGSTMTKERRLENHEIRDMVKRADEKKAGRYPLDWDGVLFCAWVVGLGLAAVVGVGLWVWINPS